MEYLYLATKIFVVLSQKSWLSINATCWNNHQSFLNPPKYFVTMITLLQVGERWRRLQPRKSKWKSRKFFLFTKLFWRELQVNDKNREPLVEEEDAIAAGFAHEAQALLPPGANSTVSLSQPPHLGHNSISIWSANAFISETSFVGILKWEMDIQLIDSIYIFSIPPKEPVSS